MIARIGLITAWIAWGIAAWLGLHAVHWFPASGTTSARDVDRIYTVMLIGSAVVFGIVAGTITVALLLFRARGGRRTAEPTRTNTKLEIAWITIPTVAMFVLSMASSVMLRDEGAAPAKGVPTLEVHVRAEQFAWFFDYPAQHVAGATTLELPVDTSVHFTITSKDVIHSFWVPQSRIKEDAVPGAPTFTRWQPTRTGNWNVVCAELCGDGHSYMRAKAKIVDRADFTRWAAAHAGAGDSGAKPDSGSGVRPGPAAKGISL